MLSEKRRSPIHPDTGMASPRELTQNPLKKIWMPYSNGRPALHASQRGGKTGSVGKGGRGEPGRVATGLGEGLQRKGGSRVKKQAQVKLL